MTSKDREAVLRARQSLGRLSNMMQSLALRTREVSVAMEGFVEAWNELTWKEYCEAGKPYGDSREAAMRWGREQMDRLEREG